MQLFSVNFFGIDNIAQEVLNKIKGKPINYNIFKIKSDDSIRCRFYCIVFIEYIISGKTLLHYISLVSPNDYKKRQNNI